MEPVEPEMMDVSFATMKGGPNGSLSTPRKFDMDVAYGTFRLLVADAFGELKESQALVWKTNRTAKSESWSELNDATDFNRIITQARAILGKDNENRRLIIEKNAAAGLKANKNGKLFVPKSVPVIKEYIVILRDKNQEQRLKDKAKTPKTDKKAEKAEAMNEVKGKAERILHNEDQIKKRVCNGCSKSCVVIPGVGNQPAIHKELRAQDIKLWAQAIEAGALDNGVPVTLERPPRGLILQLGDRQPEQRGTRTKAGTPAVEAPVVPPPPAPAPVAAPPHGYHPGPHFYGPAPGYYPPQPPYHGPAYGYHPGYAGYNAYDPYHGPGPYGYGGVRHGAPVVSGRMPLSEWLPMCDRGERAAQDYKAIF
ncbi:hypothetical protein FRC11_007541 [Ceratobasidium sp. 423]|nr:hypothetical protein FRC11_007541 [Ceratobasidium sp. 423]